MMLAYLPYWVASFDRKVMLNWAGWEPISYGIQSMAFYKWVQSRGKCYNLPLVGMGPKLGISVCQKCTAIIFYTTLQCA
jgi:hypothetical protein